MMTKVGTLATGTWVGSPSVAEAGDFYARTMPLQGWTESMTIGSDNGRILTFDKGDRSATLTIGQDGSTTRIALLYGTQTNRPAPTAITFAEPTARPLVQNEGELSFMSDEMGQLASELAAALPACE